jgi:hypothetical protein
MLPDQAGNRQLRNPPCAGDDRQARYLKSPDRGLRMACRQHTWTAEMLSSLAGGFNPSPLPLPQQITLELREADHHREHQFAGRRPRVDTEVEYAKMHATKPPLSSGTLLPIGATGEPNSTPANNYKLIRCSNMLPVTSDYMDWFLQE